MLHYTSQLLSLSSQLLPSTLGPHTVLYAELVNAELDLIFHHIIYGIFLTWLVKKIKVACMQMFQYGGICFLVLLFFKIDWFSFRDLREQPTCVFQPFLIYQNHIWLFWRADPFFCWKVSLVNDENLDTEKFWCWTFMGEIGRFFWLKHRCREPFFTVYHFPLQRVSILSSYCSTYPLLHTIYT